MKYNTVQWCLSTKVPELVCDTWDNSLDSSIGRMRINDRVMTKLVRKELKCPPMRRGEGLTRGFVIDWGTKPPQVVAEMHMGWMYRYTKKGRKRI